ncbi:hypothetical protein TNIN_421351 [Trichonephila inaurata madagascariensis]|uniref:Uncharacterized protein n=1 Tax=Trichonephila inaurata madagascariensis TaxID=2747483 RepID=A0A8X7BZP3_9ARAC|nr:hypothetical protein TNIN_421351 [Trichonephila inaurata madagascariensis]
MKCHSSKVIFAAAKVHSSPCGQRKTESGHKVAHLPNGSSTRGSIASSISSEVSSIKERCPSGMRPPRFGGFTFTPNDISTLVQVLLRSNHGARSRFRIHFQACCNVHVNL